MPRVYHQRAAKDYPNDGIKKGEMYYAWSIKTGPRSGRKFRSKTYPKPSQLTGSAFKQSLYAIEEALAEISSVDDIDDIIGQIEDLKDETQESLDNMPEGLQQGSTGELLQERIDALESWVSDLESAKDNPPDKEDDESDEDYETRVQEWLDSDVKSIEANL